MTDGRNVNAVAHAHGEKQMAGPEAVLAVEPLCLKMTGSGSAETVVPLVSPSPVPNQQRLTGERSWSSRSGCILGYCCLLGTHNMAKPSVLMALSPTGTSLFR